TFVSGDSSHAALIRGSLLDFGRRPIENRAHAAWASPDHWEFGFIHFRYGPGLWAGLRMGELRGSGSRSAWAPRGLRRDRGRPNGAGADDPRRIRSPDGF